MDYEARMDAKNDYNAEIANEVQSRFDSELDGIIKGEIEAGGYDNAVLDRAIEIVENLGVGSLNIVRSLKELKK